MFTHLRTEDLRVRQQGQGIAQGQASDQTPETSLGPPFVPRSAKIGSPVSSSASKPENPELAKGSRIVAANRSHLETASIP